MYAEISAWIRLKKKKTLTDSNSAAVNSLVIDTFSFELFRTHMAMMVCSHPPSLVDEYKGPFGLRFMLF